MADVVESFCAVELYLPDYIAKALPMIRANKGWAWFHANWGYEESKHSLALGDWLLRSGNRTEEQMADLENQVFAHEWQLPHDSPVAMLIYAMVQELATWVHYRNLRRTVDERGDPALARLLDLSPWTSAPSRLLPQRGGVLPRAGPKGTLEQLRRILLTFAMPAVHLLADSRRRVEEIKTLGIFDEDVFLHDVYLPILAALGVDHRELRRPGVRRKSRPVETVEHLNGS